MRGQCVESDTSASGMSHLQHQQWQRPSAWRGRPLADPPRAHPEIEALGVRVRRDPELADAVGPQRGDGMFEQPRADTPPDMCGQNPEVLELARPAHARERVEAEHARARDGAIDWMALDELRRQAEGVPPEADPRPGILPVALGRVSDA